MYSVDDRDRIEELRDLPQSSVGAPLPAVMADEHHTFLAYLANAVDPAWDGRSVRRVGLTTSDEIVCIVTFARTYAHFFGPPNDEAFTGHPLASRGLQPYGIFEIHDSSWVRLLERMNAVHHHHRPETFKALRHFIFAFHGSTFECIARDLEFEVRGGSIVSALRELPGRLSDTAS